MAQIPSYPTIAAIGENIDRVNALFSPFRSRDLNPEHYDQKLKFWTKSIDEFTNCDKRSSFTIKELETSFKVQNRVSACLSDVVDIIRRNGQIFTEDEYRQSLKTSNSWLSWSMKPLKFAAGSLWSLTPFAGKPLRSITKETRLVYVPAIVDLASVVQSNEDMHKLMTFEDWKEKVAQLTNPNEVDLILEYLKCRGGIVTDKLGEREIVKVGTLGQNLAITAAEKGQFDIIMAKAKLEKDLECVLEKQQISENQARQAIKQGHRMQAKHHLRSKKMYEKRSEKLESLIENLTVILFQLEDSESDGRVLAAYEAGKNALGKVLQENNMSVDRVNDTMLDLQDALDDHSEISASLAKGVADEDTTLLDEELEELLRGSESVSSPAGTANVAVHPDSSTEDALRELDKLTLDGVDELLNLSKEQKSPSQA